MDGFACAVSGKGRTPAANPVCLLHRDLHATSATGSSRSALARSDSSSSRRSRRSSYERFWKVIQQVHIRSCRAGQFSGRSARRGGARLSEAIQRGAHPQAGSQDAAIGADKPPIATHHYRAQAGGRGPEGERSAVPEPFRQRRAGPLPHGSGRADLDGQPRPRANAGVLLI